MNMRKSTAILFATALLSYSCCESNSHLTPAQKLITQIENGIQNNVIMLGHQDDPIYGHAWKYEPNRSDVLEVVGDYPAVMGWEIGGIELGEDESLDGVPFDLIRTEIIKQHQRGGINTISWHTFNPLGGNSWDYGPGVVTSILEGGKNYDMFQEWLSIVANFLASLKEPNGELIPIIFRPWHEHDGNWFWWGDAWCTHQEYLQLWDMTYDFMESRELDNLVWCYMPMFDTLDKTPPANQFDLLGIDEYQAKDDVEKYRTNLKAKIELLKEYSAKYHKPITISETGSESIPVENWWCEVVLPLIKDEPISYILFWRNAWDKPEHFYCSFKGHSSQEDFARFVANPSVITAKEVERYTKNQ